MCTQNVIPRYCKSHDPSSGVESATVVGLGFRQSLVNAG